jgi:uncharacterized protein (DUF697 family)
MQQESELLIPRTEAEIEALVKRCRALASRRALVSAGAVLVPLPGVDVAADLGVLVKLIPEINREFGLTQAQIERLESNQRVLVYKSIVAFGSAMIGRVVTQDILRGALCAVGARLAAKQVVKFVPLAGQALAAGLSFAAMKYVAEQHIRDCARVVHAVLIRDDTLAA